MTFKAIILDMDGLMVDTERLYIRCNREIARAHGKELCDSTLTRMIGRSPVESMGIFATDLGISEDPRKLVAQREEMMLRLLKTDLEPMPGLKELLDYGHGRFRLAIATGSPRMLVDEVLRQLAIAGLFDAIQTAETLPRGKPDPEIYLRAVAQLGLKPPECIVMEDSSNGVRSARAAGCYVIGVPNQDTRAQDFTPAHYVATDLRAAADHVRCLTGNSCIT